MEQEPLQFEFCVTSLSIHNENASCVFFFLSLLFNHSVKNILVNRNVLLFDALFPHWNTLPPLFFFSIFDFKIFKKMYTNRLPLIESKHTKLRRILLATMDVDVNGWSRQGVQRNGSSSATSRSTPHIRKNSHRGPLGCMRFPSAHKIWLAGNHGFRSGTENKKKSKNSKGTSTHVI